MKKKKPTGSHTDLQKGTAPHYKGAVKHYTHLAERAVANSHVIDVFACSLDQVMMVDTLYVCVCVCVYYVTFMCYDVGGREGGREGVVGQVACH
jgi:hypothetical protein